MFKKIFDLDPKEVEDFITTLVKEDSNLKNMSSG